MESSDGVGQYEEEEGGGGGGGAALLLDNDFESLSAEGTDDFHGLSSSSSSPFQYHPDRKIYFEASAGGGGGSDGVQLQQKQSPSDPPEQLISFDGVEDVPKQPDATPPGPPACPPQKNTPTIKDASGPTEMGLSGTTDDDKPCSSCAPCFSFVKNIDPRVLDLIYWHDLKKSGVVFGSVFVLLLSLALFSVLSVVAYLSLVTLTITLSFRLYKNVMSAVQKTGEGHPYKQYLELDLSISDAKVHEIADLVAKHFVCFITEIRRLFLVEDMVDSLKFALFLWVLTYIGAWFNGMTLIIIGLVAIFTLPKVYDANKVQIDEHLELARTKIKAICKQVQEKLPLPGKKKSE